MARHPKRAQPYRGSSHSSPLPAVAAVLATAMLLAAVWYFLAGPGAQATGEGGEEGSSGTAVSSAPAESSSAESGQTAASPAGQETGPVLSDPEHEPDAAATLEPASAPEPPDSPEPLEPQEPYTFGVPLEETEPPESDAVFDDAVFLGDSRTEGLQAFSGLKNGTFYWDRGMSVFRADSEEYAVFQLNGEPATMMDMLASDTYQAVYLLLGINELGYPVASYQSALYQLLDRILALQPEAVVYLETMPPVNEAMAAKNKLGSWITNENVDAFNEVIVQAAADKHVVLLDTASLYRDSSGELPENLSSDGVHFTVGGYGAWAEYLRTHRMDRDRYLWNRAQAEAETG